MATALQSLDKVIDQSQWLNDYVRTKAALNTSNTSLFTEVSRLNPAKFTHSLSIKEGDNPVRQVHPNTTRPQLLSPTPSVSPWDVWSIILGVEMCNAYTFSHRLSTLAVSITFVFWGVTMGLDLCLYRMWENKWSEREKKNVYRKS